MGSGYGMNMGYGGMGMDMDDMDWPRRCRSRCAYTKRDSFDNRMFCFARSDYSQSMCIADDYDGEKPINVSEWEGYGSGGGYGYGMGNGNGMNMGYGGMGMDMDDMDWPRRCRSRCAYTKRDSFDNRMFCFARSEYSQSMCIADDYDGEKPIN